MRAKPISFAQVLKTKGRSKVCDTSSSSTLAEMMQQFEESPSEDFTLYLGPVSPHQKGKVSSFRAMGSKISNHEQSEIFDSWIQKQSFVSNKENQVRQLGTSRNFMESQRDGREVKKIVLSSKGKENKEPLKSVADLVRKIQLNQSNTNAPFFKASSKPLQENDRLADDKPHKREEPQMGQRLIQQRHNQPTSFRANNYEVNIKAPSPSPKIAEKPSAKPYIEQVSVTKQRPEQSTKDELKQLIAKTEYIHLEIAQLAQDYMQAEAEQQEKEEDSLLIDYSDKKQPPKEEIIQPISTVFTEGEEIKLKEEKVRWEAAKNRMNLYLKKITHDESSEGSKLNGKPSMPEANHYNVSNQINIPHNSVGYSFAVNEAPVPQKQEKPCIPTLQFVSIPKVQQIQSERLPYEYSDWQQQNHNLNSPPLIPQGKSIPNIQSVRMQCYASPEKQQQNQAGNPSARISMKHINSSLMFSQNIRDTPSSNSSEEKELAKRNSDQSQQQCVSLSFTEEKPEIMVNIPLNYAEEQPEEFQLQTVEVKKEAIQDNQFVASPSPSASPFPQTKMHFTGERLDYEQHDAPTEEIPIQPTNSNHFEEFYIEGVKAEPKVEIVAEGLEAMKIKVDEIPYKQVRKQPIFKEAEKQLKSVEFSIELPREPTQASLKQPIVEPIAPLQTYKQLSFVIDNLSEIPIKEQPEPIFVPSIQASITQMKKSITKNSNESSKGSPSSSMFGLKKVYSSPKTQPVSIPAVSTSPFSTTHEFKLTKIEIPTVDKLRYNNATKHYQKKIETVAYTYNNFKKEEPKPKIEEDDNEEFQFQF